jgi:hypothetical protein
MGGGWGDSYAAVASNLPQSGTVSDFYVNISTPLATDLNMYVLKNNGTTTVTCTITAGSTSCSDTTHSWGFAAGDVITVLYQTLSYTTFEDLHWSAAYH